MSSSGLSGPLSTALSAQERAHYDSLFATADADKDGRIGASDAAFFLTLGLEKKTLSEIWQLADPERKGYLSKESFYLSLRLASLARQGRPLSVEAALSGPAFMKESGTASSQPQPQPQPQPALARADPAEEAWVITAQERAKFEEIFDKADEDKDGFVTGPQAKKLFSRSGLDMEDLGKIWTLSDVNQDRQLDREEFVVAMYLINARLKGRQLPSTLPLSLRTAPPPTEHLAPATEETWILAPEERSKYEEIFRKADEDNDGYVTGEQARQLFGRSGLPLTDLAKIWTLSDVDGDRRLDLEEFAIAMYFINARLKGRRLPDTLPSSIAKRPSSAPVPVAVATPVSLSPPGSGPFPRNTLIVPSSPSLESTHGVKPEASPPVIGDTREDEMKAKLEEIRMLAVRQQKLKEEAEKKLQEERRRTEEAQAELSKEETRLQQVSAEVKKLQADLESEKNKGIAIKAKLNLVRERGQAAQEQHEQLQRMLTERVAQRREEEDVVRLLEQKVEERKSAIEGQKQELAKLNETAAALRAKRATLESQTAALDRQYESQRALLGPLQEESKLLSDQVAQLSLQVKKDSSSPLMSLPTSSDSDFFGRIVSEGATPSPVITKKLPATPLKKTSQAKPPTTATDDFFGIFNMDPGIDANETRDSFGSGAPSFAAGFDFANFSPRQDATPPQVTSTSSSLLFTGFDPSPPKSTDAQGSLLFSSDDAFA